MGGGSWDTDTYTSAASSRKASGTRSFAYSHDTMSKPTGDWKAHETLDPKTIKDSLNHVRESRDSAEHPETKAVSVLFDVTGSMSEVPEIFQKNLANLMSYIIMKGGLEHPQIMVGGIGDATCDKIPFQISQFESDNRIDEHLRNIVLEGGGGGQNTESYELALYAMARLTSLDCLEKRGQKGYLFLSGDEHAYGMVKKSEVKEVFGITEQENIPLAKIIEEVKEKFEVYFIIPALTSHYNEPGLKAHWTKNFGQNVLTLEKPEAICELIASTIALAEGTDLMEIMSGLKDTGVDAALIGSVSKALSTVTAGVTTKKAVSSETLPTSDKKDTIKKPRSTK